MTYDETLADRIREQLAARPDVTEKKMFGGLAFLIGGNLAVAASGQGGLLVRCAPAATDEHLVDGAEAMIMRGKPLDGWLRVDDRGVTEDDRLAHWVRIGATTAAALPAKRQRS